MKSIKKLKLEELMLKSFKTSISKEILSGSDSTLQPSVGLTSGSVMISGNCNYSQACGNGPVQIDQPGQNQTQNQDTVYQP